MHLKNTDGEVQDQYEQQKDATDRATGATDGYQSDEIWV